MNVQELIHCLYSDDFNARLGRFIAMFEKFGLDLDDARRATIIVSELGNNVFDHNLGNWPTNIRGCFIAAQNYPKKKKIEFAVGDPGVGFLGSLKTVLPGLKDDIEAIKKGLEGHTGRVDEKRGKGLKVVQEWTIDTFSGTLAIHSGSGLVTVDKNGVEATHVNRLLGTLAQFVINYR